MFMRPLLLRTSEVIRRSEAAGKQQSAALMQCHLIQLTQDGPRDQRGRQRDSKSPPYESHSIHRLLDYLSLQTALIVWSRNVPRQPSAALQIKTDSFLPYISSHLIKTQKAISFKSCSIYSLLYSLPKAQSCKRTILVNDLLYWLLTLHMDKCGQDTSTTKKCSQNVENPINPTLNENSGVTTVYGWSAVYQMAVVHPNEKRI